MVDIVLRVTGVFPPMNRPIDDTLALLGRLAIAWREAEGNPYEPSGAPWVGPQAVLELPAVCRHGATAGDHDDTVNA